MLSVAGFLAGDAGKQALANSVKPKFRPTRIIRELEASDFGAYNDFDGQCVVVLDKKQTERVLVVQGYKEVSVPRAAFIVKAVNHHTELVEVLEHILNTDWKNANHSSAAHARKLLASAKVAS